jgi:hypothetical protein
MWFAHQIKKMSRQPSSEQLLHSSFQEGETTILLTGEGNTTYDQLSRLVDRKANMPIILVGPNLGEEVRSLAAKHGVHLLDREPELHDLDLASVIICTGTDTEKNKAIVQHAHQKGLFVHVVNTPALSDLYSVPNPRDERNEKFHELRWKKAATWILFAFLFMIIGHFSLYYIPAGELWDSALDNLRHLDASFKWMVLTGFCAQLIDGLLGMGYGLTCTTVLLSLGIQLPAISGSIHTAEMFSSGISGYTHYKFGNINKKLFYALLIPGVVGAILGAVLLSLYGDTYAAYVKPILAVYTLLLGLRILLKAFRKKREKKKAKHVSLLAGAGGFLDSFGGGGWGPLVTSTLISGGRTPKYVIGSVSATEFFVTLVSALTFFTMIGIGYWQVIAGLIVGGAVAAPIAARLSGKLPVKFMFIGVGALAIVWSLKILIASIF